jgi:UDP-GlcNAc:undecaprenyl-phosphate GlcNAc-1-phosphate transferase
LGLFKAYAIVAFFVPVLLYLLPIFDLLFAAVRRVLTGHSPMQADKSHLHHKLIAIGFSQKQAVVILYGIAAILGFCAVMLATDHFSRAFLIIGVAFIVILIGAVILYRKEKKLEKEEQQEEKE